MTNPFFSLSSPDLPAMRNAARRATSLASEAMTLASANHSTEQKCRRLIHQFHQPTLEYFI